jgi:hypothetical protein
MQEAFLTDLNESGNNVLQEFDSFFLSESSLFLDKSAEIALIAKLGNNVAMWSFPNDIETLENIMMFDGSECFNFTIKHFSANGIFYSFHVDGLDRHNFI